MADLTYTFDGNLPPGSLKDVILDRYGPAFTDAVKEALGAFPSPDLDGDENNVAFQVMDQTNEVFEDGTYEGAFVLEGNKFQNLDVAPIIVFASDEDDGVGIDISLKGDVPQIIGGTFYDDKITFITSPDDAGTFIDSGNGGDTLNMGSSDDTVIAGQGNDRVRGADGDDDIDGGTGNDWLSGGAGDDDIEGGAGNDTIYGDSGENDHLNGGADDDSIVGGTGHSTISGGTGFDVALMKAGKADDYTFDGSKWADGDGNEILSDTEFTRFSGNGKGTLITVVDEDHADVARLFQMLTNQDPTAAQLQDALQAFDDGDTLDAIAQGIDGSLSGNVSTAAQIQNLVTGWINNAIDGSGALTPAQITQIVNDMVNTYVGGANKAEMAADLVTRLDAADEHIHIAVIGQPL